MYKSYKNIPNLKYKQKRPAAIFGFVHPASKKNVPWLIRASRAVACERFWQGYADGRCLHNA